MVLRMAEEKPSQITVRISDVLPWGGRKVKHTCWDCLYVAYSIAKNFFKFLLDIFFFQLTTQSVEKTCEYLWLLMAGSVVM